MLDINMNTTVDDNNCLNFPVHNATSVCPSSVESAASVGTFSCMVTCSDPNVMYILSANRIDDAERSDSLTPQFLLFTVCMALVYGGMAGANSITNAMCFALLGNKRMR